VCKGKREIGQGSVGGVGAACWGTDGMGGFDYPFAWAHVLDASASVDGWMHAWYRRAARKRTCTRYLHVLSCLGAKQRRKALLLQTLEGICKRQARTERLADLDRRDEESELRTWITQIQHL
jgi:hypothetical protein